MAFEDLTVGMKVTGKIRNVVDFGAFVDIGLHETGLIHVSELSDSFVSDPMEVIKVGDVKEFTIIALDADRRRISLSLKSDAASRIEHVGMGTSAASKTGTKKIVVVKKGTGTSGAKVAVKPAGQRTDKPRRDPNDDGMSYNPFAALLKK